MKKLFSLLTALLVAITMVAAPAAQNTGLARRATHSASTSGLSVKEIAKQPLLSAKSFKQAPNRVSSKHGMRHNPLTQVRTKANLNRLGMRAPAYAAPLQADVKGSMIYDETWTDLPQGSTAPEGLYQVPVNSASGFDLLYLNEKLASGSFKAGDKIYGIYVLTFWGYILANDFCVIDAATGEIESTTEFQTDYAVISSTYYEPLNAAIACAQNSETGAMVLLKIALDGQVSVLADSNVAFAGGMCAAKDGKIYGLDGSGAIYSINPSTYAATQLGNCGVTTDYLSCCAYDDANGVIYFPTCPEEGASEFYSIDPSTLTATYRYSFATNIEFGLLYVDAPLADATAPAAPSDLVASFPDGALSGTITFLPPTTLFNGSAASGDITYTVQFNGETVATGNTAFGADAVTVDYTVAEANNYSVAVYCTNATGDGAPARTNLYIGKDKPAKLNSVNAAYASGKFNVSWAAVTSVNGGFINADEVTYTVTRYVNDVPTVVAAAQKQTTFTEDYTEPTALETVYFTVSASYDGAQSEPTSSNLLTLGAIVPPYSCNFPSTEVASTYTIVDNNGDKNTWKYVLVNGYGAMQYNYSTSYAADDYLILPAAKLEAGKVYSFSMLAGNSDAYTEKIAVYAGTSANPDDLTTEVIAPTELTDNFTVNNGVPSGKELSGFFTPATSGTYYFAVKACSDADMFRLYVTNIAISAPMAGGVPAAVKDLTITPNPQGELSATINFTAPSTTLAGDQLTDLSYIEVWRDDELVQTVTPAPGASVTVQDTEPVNGNNTYTVTCFNDEGSSPEATATAFIGINVPQSPENVVAANGATEGQVVITWDAVTKDINGNNLTSVSYIVTRLQDEKWVIVAEDVTTLSYTDDYYESTSEQQFAQYAIFAENETGYGQGTPSDLVCVGPAYTIPFAESGSLEKLMGFQNISGNPTWQLGDDTTYDDLLSQDGDQSYFIFKGNYIDEASRLFTGRIAIPAETASPAFSFYYFCLADNDQNTLQVEVNDGSGWQAVESAITCGDGVVDEWNRIIINLDAYKGKTIQVGIVAKVASYKLIALDNLQVYDQPENDLAVELSFPGQVKAGDTVKAVATVSNYGAADSEGYSVDLIVNGKVVANQASTSLATGASKAFIFDYAVSAAEQESFTVAARVNCSEDNIWSNNTTAPLAVTVIQSALAAVTDLAGEASEGGVDLTWSAPEYANEYTTFTETFEEYDSFATMANGNIGDWKFVDNDGSPVGGFQDLDIPNVPVNSAASFFIFDSSAPEYNLSFGAHSGVKYLAALYNTDGSQNDDWAISPELSGNAQTITFFARSYSGQYPESVEVLYSTTDTETASFTSVTTFKNLPANSDYSFTEYSFEVPAGAKYFAFRFVSKDTFMVLIDDVTYQPAGAKQVELVGYNVYRDGVKLNDTPITATTYHDAEIIPDASYAVTAVYNTGESKGSNVVYPNGSAVEALKAATQVKGSKGAIVISGATEAATVVDMQGRVIYAGDAANIPAPAGAYIVRIAAKTYKVLVK